MLESLCEGLRGEVACGLGVEGPTREECQHCREYAA
jgi:hypothetical protein